MSNKLIMVVDDDESVRSYLCFSLQAEGYRTLEAPDAEKALKLLEKSLPDLILLDIMLPKMDGFEMCGLLRKNVRTQKVPVLFITASLAPNNLQRAKEVGAQGLVEKPFTYSQLLTHVMEAFSGHFSVPTRLKFNAPS